MEITFDPRKREETLEHRGLDFARAGELFGGFHFTVEDVRRDYGEPRFQSVGSLAGQVVMVVWTPRGKGLSGEIRRIISMRRCHVQVRNEYERSRLDRSR